MASFREQKAENERLTAECDRLKQVDDENARLKVELAALKAAPAEKAEEAPAAKADKGTKGEVICLTSAATLS